MQVLFENYYNDALKFSEELYRNLLKNPPAISEEVEGGALITVINGMPDIIVYFYKKALAPNADAYAFMINIHDDKRSTVTTKTGRKYRRKLVKEGIMGVNVANIIQQYKNKVCDYDKLKKYIKPAGSQGYAFDENISMQDFLYITMDLITTNEFAKIFVHEAQHFYNPYVHQRAEQIRKYDTGKKLTVQQQRRVNYVFSDREVNSAIAEAAVGVIGDPIYKKFLSSPKFLRRFVNACIDQIASEGAWTQYPAHIKQKMIKRWTQIFHERVKKKPNA